MTTSNSKESTPQSVKVSAAQLQELVRNMVHGATGLTEGQDFTARRMIQMAAQRVAFEFEDEIRTALNLNPDLMTDDVQKRYHQVAEEMKMGVVKAVMTAVSILSQFPKPAEVDTAGNSSSKE